MKKILLFLIALLLQYTILMAQDSNRIQQIRNRLEVLSVDNKGLTEPANVNVQNASLSDYLLAISKVHKVNLNVSPELSSINIINNFNNVAVADLLVYLCKEYQLDIDFTGNILTVYKYTEPVVSPPEKQILVTYNSGSNTINMDLQNDPMERVFRKVMDETGKNLLYSPELGSTPLTIYLKDVPLETGLAKLAETNGLIMNRSRDGFFTFEAAFTTQTPQIDGQPGQTVQVPRPTRRRSSNFYFKVVDREQQLLEVDFENVPIENVVNDIGMELDIDMFTASPLTNAGTSSFKRKNITFDKLLETMFEGKQTYNGGLAGGGTQAQNNTPRRGNPSQPQAGTPAAIGGFDQLFTFRKEDNTYFFGTIEQLSVRNVEIVPLLHRSVEIFGDPSQGGTNRTVGRTSNNSFQTIANPGINNQSGSGGGLGTNFQQGGNRRDGFRSTFGGFGGGGSEQLNSILDIFPDQVKMGLQIKADKELNSFLVSGPQTYIERFKEFVERIDKPVPVILIETMFIDVSKIYTVSTGISWGIGTEPTQTQGEAFPSTNITLGAETVNRVLGSISGLGTIQVVPEFYAQIQAMEENGDIKVLSTPKISTLNGHRATFSNGETTYYAVTNVITISGNNPQNNAVRNYQPIDAELAITIRPLLSNDGQITLDVNVIQSDFTGNRIEEDAPPDQVSREFSSIIRVQDQDIVVLGGLEEKTKNDTGRGVPILSRIPVIKWFFSKRTREDSKRKLTVLIKPTVIN